MEIKEILENLKKLRTEKGLTQKEFADKIGISRTAVSKWENKKNGIPTAFLVKIIDFYGLSEKEQSNLSNFEKMNEKEKAIASSYEKVISFMKTATLVSFENDLYNATFPIDVPFDSYEDLTEESKLRLENELKTQLTKDLYLTYCEEITNEIRNEHLYVAFSNLLKENQLAASLFHFGLMWNEYDDYFQKWLKEEKQENFLNLNDNLKIEMKNFNGIINSKRLTSMHEIFNNSINQDLVGSNILKNSWLKYF